MASDSFGCNTIGILIIVAYIIMILFIKIIKILGDNGFKVVTAVVA